MINVDFEDDPFDDLELDESAIAQIDALEGQHLRGTTSLVQGQPVIPLPNDTNCAGIPSWATGVVSAAAQPILSARQAKSNVALRRMDRLTAYTNQCDGYRGDDTITESVAGPSRLPAQLNSRPWRRTSSATSSSARLVQRNLFGDVALSSPASGCLVMSSQAGEEQAGTKKARRTKQWDQRLRNDMVISGGRRSTQMSSEVRVGGADIEQERASDDYGVEEIDQWNSQSPKMVHLPHRPSRETFLPPDSMKLQLDRKAAQKFIYPINMAKRDYQFNIVQRALYDNVLVALPTGLGKTFIAAVVILNFFHWYPKGKIVFVAPTRPLVNQQQVACHGICGLPWDLACEMTGNTTKSRRGDEWEEKRIFYMTPQTLDNDLRTGDIDPKDIVCLVVDEAHRATGNYAYCNIVAQIQAVNPYFRILALTATPGSTADRVQEVIDNLHISLIELRTEQALDIRQYIHRKHEETITVAMTDDFQHVRNLYLDAMRDNCEALVKHGLLPNADPSTLHPFRVRSVYVERKDIISKKRWLGATISETARMAEARSSLDIFSIRMFRSRLQDLVEGIKKQDAKKMKLAQILNLAASIPDQAHPKMIAAVDTILSHFDREQKQGNDSTRVMVFCSLRECVHEIVELLNANGLKATPFIGQSADKQGRGLTQKQQKEIIEKFKKGIINVIVATSIGEEGLDIGEVDLIVCYEAVKDSVRMLQRVGRTGRKRDGRIVVLMSEGPESSIWQKSKDTYKGVQNTINAGHSVTLFDDVPRLIPPSIKPVATFEELDQPDFRPELIGKRATSSSGKTGPTAKSKRRKERLTNVKSNVPEGAIMGFLRASSLTSSKVKARLQEGYEEELENDPAAGLHRGHEQYLTDDSDDEALERGLNLNRQISTDFNGSASAGKHASTAPQAGHANSSTVTKQRQRLGVRRPVRRLAVEDSDGIASDDSGVVELTGLEGNGSPCMKGELYVNDVYHEDRRPLVHPDPVHDANGSVLRLKPETQCDAEGTVPSTQEFDASWSIDAEALVDLTQTVTRARPASRENSPEVYRRRDAHPLIASLAGQRSLSEPEAENCPDQYHEAATSLIAHTAADRARDDLERNGTINEPTEPEIARPPKTVQALSASQEESPVVVRCGRRRPLRPIVAMSSPDQTPETSARCSRHFNRSRDAIPSEIHSASERSKKRKATRPSRGDAQAGRTAKVAKKRIGNSPTSRAFFRFEAERATDEERRGERSDSDDEGANTDSADSSDLEHVGEFQPTQAPRGYNQRSIYQQSLLTQGAPTPFRRKTVGGFVGGRYGIRMTPDDGSPEQAPGARRAVRVDEDDCYSVDSFVCDDNEVEYASDVAAEGEGSCSDD